MSLSKKVALKQIIINRIFASLGYAFIFFPIAIIALTFYPVFKAELTYQISPHPSVSNITVKPIDSEFSILIPKININTKVTKNVDPYDSQEYQIALTKGVAHAQGSSLPGFPGNTFIFAHSASNWYQANQYNAVFYLINKLEINDEIIIYYEGSRYLYLVSEKKIVKNNEINYLTNSPQNSSILTLMTCWPPGTGLSRLLVIAKPYTPYCQFNQKRR